VVRVQSINSTLYSILTKRAASPTGVTLAVTNDASDSATGPALCYARNDLPRPFKGTVLVEVSGRHRV
jgi:hypothetical protein